jgi:hypothetical protein
MLVSLMNSFYDIQQYLKAKTYFAISMMDVPSRNEPKAAKGLISLGWVI